MASSAMFLLQACKNGFFYVLDAASGELLSARPFTEVTGPMVWT